MIKVTTIMKPNHATLLIERKPKHVRTFSFIRIHSRTEQKSGVYTFHKEFRKHLHLIFLRHASFQLYLVNVRNSGKTPIEKSAEHET